MKKAKRIASLLLVLVMVLGLFAGCGKKTASVKGDGKITVGIPQDVTIKDYDENGLTKYLEEVTGLEIEWKYYAGSVENYKQQLTLQTTSGETLPDVLLGMSLGHYIVNQFGEDGYFMDLSELMETNAPNYQKAMEGLSKKEQAYITQKMVNTVDGESIYAMPYYQISCVDNMQSMMHINKTWLDAVGMQVPTNLKELEAVCEAFLTQDPNGNGEADEYAMLADEGTRNWIINAFTQYQQHTFCVDENGKVFDPVYTDEFRQAVQYINGLVEEEYLNELGFTLSLQEIKNLISPPDETECKVGIFAGHPETMTNANTDVLDEFVAMGVLADETGKGGYNVISEVQLDFTGIITEDCADPEEAMLFLDAFYTDECVTRQRHGVKDEDWYYEEGENAYGTKSYARIINPDVFFDGSLNKTLGNKLGIMTHWNYLSVKETAETNSNNRIVQASRLQTELWDVHENSGKKQAGVVGDLVYTQEEYDVREEKYTPMNSYTNSQIVLFMQGENDPDNDKEWNEFLSTLTDQGRKELMKIAQSAYTRKVEREASIK